VAAYHDLYHTHLARSNKRHAAREAAAVAAAAQAEEAS
jgi:hypothetical protein